VSLFFCFSSKNELSTYIAPVAYSALYESLEVLASSSAPEPFSGLVSAGISLPVSPLSPEFSMSVDGLVVQNIYGNYGTIVVLKKKLSSNPTENQKKPAV
jgi:hypothetical protein